MTGAVRDRWARGRWTRGVRRTFCTVASALSALLASGPGAPAPAAAEPLGVTVRNEQGEPVRDAVVQAMPLGATASAAPAPEPVVIDQVDREFVPYVTVVPVGTSVSFPNRDQIRHHVYSFSEAKTFEIPLYEGTPAELVEFDRAGEVVLGCNIHDWMKAYVFVAETPWFGLTDEEGRVHLDLPPGEYRLEVWHPRKDESDASGRRIRVASGGSAPVELSIEEKRLWTPRRAPSLSGSRYR